MDKRSAWDLREGDQVMFNNEVWTVTRNERYQNSAMITREGWIENVRWTYLKKAPKKKISMPQIVAAALLCFLLQGCAHVETAVVWLFRPPDGHAYNAMEKKWELVDKNQTLCNNRPWSDGNIGQNPTEETR